MTTARPQSLAQWLAYQQRVHARSIDMELGRVRAVAGRLQLLRPAGRVVTVGGTNGKGSTAVTLAALLGAHGLAVGLFTSPHLYRYNERIAINGALVDDATLIDAFERIEAARTDITLTFFEYSTLAALQIFRDRAVDAMVLEVGLGGRLDATNIVDADVAVLCSIGLDHCDWLGDTLELIGAEKAGILRSHRPVVLGSEAMPASVLAAARELACEMWRPGHEYHARVDADGQWSFDSMGCTLAGLPAPRLAGRVQYDNAATALAALQALRMPDACARAPIVRGLAAVRLPGRLQIIPGAVEWVLDVAHNEPAAAVLAAALRALPGATRTIAVFGVLADKDVTAIAHQLENLIDEWILCSITDEPRGLSAQALGERLGPVHARVQRVADVAGGCVLARTLARAGDRVVVCGSFHTVGPALDWLGSN